MTPTEAIMRMSLTAESACRCVAENGKLDRYNEGHFRGMTFAFEIAGDTAECRALARKLDAEIEELTKVAA